MAAEDPGAVAAVLPSGERPIRAAEVVGALSLATDLGTGQPLEHALRTAVLAVRLGELAEASAQELVDTDYVALLHSSGCTSDGHEAGQRRHVRRLTRLPWSAPKRGGSTRKLPHATPGRSPLAGDYKGREAIFAQFGQYGGQTGGTFRATLRHVLTSEDGLAIGLHHHTAERDGKQLDVCCCIVFEIKDGRVIDGREHFSDLYAWDEFWS